MKVLYKQPLKIIKNPINPTTQYAKPTRPPPRAIIKKNELAQPNFSCKKEPFWKKQQPQLTLPSSKHNSHNSVLSREFMRKIESTCTSPVNFAASSITVSLITYEAWVLLKLSHTHTSNISGTDTFHGTSKYIVGEYTLNKDRKFPIWLLQYPRSTPMNIKPYPTLQHRDEFKLISLIFSYA